MEMLSALLRFYNRIHKPPADLHFQWDSGVGFNGFIVFFMASLLLFNGFIVVSAIEHDSWFTPCILGVSGAQTLKLI